MGFYLFKTIKANLIGARCLQTRCWRLFKLTTYLPLNVLDMLHVYYILNSILKRVYFDALLLNYHCHLIH